MAQDFSFDVVSEINWQELVNAVDQTQREIANRFDFKGTKVSLELKDKELFLVGDDEGKLKQLKDVFESKLIKRNISLKAVDYQKLDTSALGLVKQKALFISGIASDIAKKINILIRDSKLKVRSQIIDEKVRVFSRDKDELQSVMKLLKEKDVGIPLQFNNYR